MPLYDWECDLCGLVFERVGTMAQTATGCPECQDAQSAFKKFTPNANIAIPGHFRMDRGWHLPPGGSDTSSSADLNSRVHQPKRTSFKERFDQAWRG